MSARRGAVNPHTLAAGALEQARRCGATAADLLFVEADSMAVRVRMGAIERLESAQEKRLGLRCFFGRRSASTSTSDLSPDAVTQLVELTCRLAQVTAEDPYAGLPEPAELAKAIPNLELWDAAASNMTADERITLAKRAEAAALEADPRINNSEGADCDYAGSTVWYAASNGFFGSYQATRTSLSVTPVAAQNGQMQRDYWYSSGRHLSHLISPEEIGRVAARRTLRRLGARRVATQQAPVIFEPETAAQLLGTIASALSGYSLYRRASFLVDQLEQPVAASVVTIEDDGTMMQEVGSKPFDGEGLPTRKKLVVDAGVLRSYLLDSYTARKLKLRPTGNAARGVGDSPGVGPTNFRLLPGSASPQQIIGSVANGLYVTELIGFGINLATGDYSQGAAGLWIERGELAYPVEEVTIAGNLRDMLKQIEAVGNDLPPHRGVASPTIKIGRMTIAGA
ncbi:MAG: metallopeptidase TldD-related protein [Nitrospirota bacterium]